MEAYSAAERPTVPSHVTPDTPIESLNLNWREADLPESQRTKHVHRLHPYLGKFIPQLVEIFLRKYFMPGQTVLDPFCGSGTTLVQANELGINSVGFDISAFNVTLCRAKTTKYELQRVRQEVLDVLERDRDSSQKHSIQPSLFDTGSTFSISPTDNEYLQKWFAPTALYELLAYRELLIAGDYEYKDLLQVVLSRSARSARLTTHFDLDFPKRPQAEPYWCYKHSRECSPTTDAFQFLKRYSADTLARVEAFARLRTDADVAIYHADSSRVQFPPADGIITSPPYVGLIDYHEQHAYAYHLLGLADNREQEIGAAANGSGQKAQRQYQEDIAGVFSRAARSMPSGARMIVVAHDRANLYDEIARLAGVAVEATINRHVNRRTGRRGSDFYESVFVWRKP